MTHKECADWFSALAQALPRSKSVELRRALSRWGRRFPGGRWQVGLWSGAPFSAATLRWFAGEDGDSPSRAWTWDLKRDRLTGERVFRRGALVSQPVTADWATDPALAALFSDFAALCPLRDLVAQRKTEGFSLRLERGVPWPLFARASAAEPFAAESARLAYLLRDLKVEELAFDAGSLGVYLSA